MKSSLGLAEKFHVYEKSMPCTVLTVVWKASVYLLICHLPWTVSIIKPFLVLEQIRRQRLFYKCSLVKATQQHKYLKKHLGLVLLKGLRFFKGASLQIYFLHVFSLSSLSWFPANSRGTNKQTRGLRSQSLPACALSGQNDELSCPQLWWKT